jgi:hypothetical protein
MSLRNALGLFFLGLILTASPLFWYDKPREHFVLIAAQVLVGLAMMVWAYWKAPKTWKRPNASRDSRDNVAA